MYLIHWPTPARDLYLDTWRAIEKLQADGRVRTVGVSNFQPDHLRRLLEHSAVTPAVNQVELHPYLQQAPLRAFHAEHGIATEAWSPLAQGALLEDATITSIARKHGKSPAQVVLRWHLQLGQHRHPQVRHARTHPREHRRLRLRPLRRGHGRRGRPRPGHADGSRPRHPQLAGPVRASSRSGRPLRAHSRGPAGPSCVRTRAAPGTAEGRAPALRNRRPGRGRCAERGVVAGRRQRIVRRAAGGHRAACHGSGGRRSGALPAAAHRRQRARNAPGEPPGRSQGSHR